MVETQAKIEMETEWSIRQSIEATTKLQTLQMEREDNCHRPLIDSIDNAAQTVEDSSAFAQSKKPVERHPFLTELLEPSIVRRLRGRWRPEAKCISVPLWTASIAFGWRHRILCGVGERVNQKQDQNG
ncbi:hypothetical protein [Variovorax sp. EL159]|uniref:hypothetical protein n=1 Tax=Variovorax sp. EL159 TaxID=1566270 RepID=UPI000B80BFB1|nr:hypothetical protein [Variovorax sp. EL159]